MLGAERRLGRMGDRCVSARGARGGSTVGRSVRTWIGLGIGLIVWRGESSVECCLDVIRQNMCIDA